MPIREETDQDPSNGAEIFGYFDNLLDVNLSGLVDGSYIRYDLASQSWLPVTGILPAPASLDDLTDTNTASAVFGNFLMYAGGSGWVPGTPIDTSGGGSPASTLDDLTDVSTSAAVFGRFLMYGGASGWVPGIPVDTSGGGSVDLTSLYGIGIFAPTGLILGSGANNAAAINNQVNTVGYCYLPSGDYYVSNHVSIGKNNAKLFGPGRIVANGDFANSQIIYVPGTGCSIEDVVIDGYASPASTLGVNMAGPYGRCQNITVQDTTLHGITLGGYGTTLNNSRFYRCAMPGGNAIEANALLNFITDCVVEGYGTKGIAIGSPYRNTFNDAFCYVGGCFIKTGTGIQPNIENCILVDSGPPYSGYNQVVIRNTVCDFQTQGTGAGSDYDAAVVKVALCDNVLIEGCSFISSLTGVHIDSALHVAEGVGNLTVRNTLLSPNVTWEVNTLGDRISDTFNIENCQIGGTLPNHRNYIALDDIRARNIKIDNCYIYNSGSTTAINTDLDAISRLEITNNRIVGNTASNYSVVAWNTGTVEYYSRKIYYSNNSIANSGGGGLFTASTPAMRILLTAKDREATVFQQNAPTSPTTISQIEKISFSVGDRVLNTGTLFQGVVSEWICTSGGKPGAWEAVSYIAPTNPLFMGIYAPTGLSVATGVAVATSNSVILQAALDRGGLVYLPSGTYSVSGVMLRTNYTTLFGPGVLKSSTGSTMDAVVQIDANYCTLRDITIDGANRKNPPGRGEGLRINGDYNIADSIYIVNVPTGVGDTSAGCYAVGNYNTLTKVYVSGGDIAAFRNFGENTYRDVTAVGWGYKGFSHVGTAKSLVVDGFYGVCNTFWHTNGRCVFQIDPSTRYLDNAFLSNIKTDSIPELMVNGDAAFKAALVGNLNINNCLFGHSSGLFDTMIIAEDVQNIDINNSVIAKHLNFNITAGNVPKNFAIRNSTVGSTGQFFVNSNIFDLQCSGNMIFENCTFYGFVQRAIDFDSTSGSFQSLRMVDCNFIGSGANVYDIDSTSTALSQGNHIISLRNTRSNLLAGGNSLTSSNAAKRRVLSTIDEGGMNYLYSSAPSSASDGYWNAGTKIWNSAPTSGGFAGWVCTAEGSPGSWALFGDVNNFGILGGSVVTTSFQAFVDGLGNETTVRIPAGDYYLDRTIVISGKVNVTFDVAPGARFIETQRLPSGTFIMHRCSGINWYGGTISGADTLSFILRFASGVEFAGKSFEQYGPNDTESGSSLRYVLGQGISTNYCGNILFQNMKIYSKYRAFSDYMGQNITFDNMYHNGVHTGAMDQTLDTVVTGSGNCYGIGINGSASLGAIFKETQRTTLSISLIRTNRVRIINCISENTGGLMVAGNSALGAGPFNHVSYVSVDNCIIHNPYDNGVYLSNGFKCVVQNCHVVTDEHLPMKVSGMKGRGRYLVFTNNIIERSYHGFGIEGYGSTADGWTASTTVGWTSEGCVVSNNRVIDCIGQGVFLDNNGTIYPRDTTIENNYFYNCGLGPYARTPTGYTGGMTQFNICAIGAADGLRTRIVGNTIEYTGALSPDYAIFVGGVAFPWISGVVVADNKILGAKAGVYLRQISDSVVRDNYGERIGYWNTYPFIGSSGVPSLIVCENVKNTRIKDNVLAPTGHAVGLLVLPETTFSNVKRTDNDGIEVFY